MRRLLPSVCLALGAVSAWAQPSAPPAPVVAGGSVPDAAGKAAILARLHALFDAGRVVDQIAVGGVAAPPDWQRQVQLALGEKLRLVKKGSLQVEGNVLTLRGEVGSAPARQEIGAELAGRLDPAYTFNNALRVAAQEQELVDQALGRRIVEFEPGKAALTATGQGILDDIAAALLKLPGKRVEVVGHTDNRGARAANIALSQARAEAVKAYLASKGIAAAAIDTQGRGPDQPVADNGTDAGRARNRRIEFNVR